MDDLRMRGLMNEARPAPTMLIAASDLEITFTDDQGRVKRWSVNGRKRQEAQMEGGVIELLGKWKGKAVILEREVPESATLHREFRLSDDGTAPPSFSSAARFPRHDS